MKVQNIRKKLKLLFVVALSLCFLAFSNEQILFAAAPTVTTGVASSITKTTATIDYTISDDGGKGITSKGFEYGTTTSYGSTSTATAFFYGNDQFFGQGGAYVGEEGQQSDSIGITRDTLGNVYVAEFGGNRIQKFNSSGVFQSMFGWGVDTGANAFEICTSGCEIALPGTGNGQFNLPSGIAIDSSGNIYVVESGGSRIQKFNSSFAYQSQFGASGTSEGQFTIENGIAIDASDNIYVVDAGNSRIQKFNSSGVFQSMFGWGVDTGANAFEICTSGCQAGISGGGNGQFNFLNTDNGLSNASDIAFDSSGNIYVVDSGNNRIQKFDSMGNYVSQYGTYGTGQDEFVGLRSISIDQNDDIYAVYGTDFDRVKKIDTNYNFYSSYIIGGPFYLYSSFVDLQGKLFLGGTSVVILYLNQYYGTVGLSGLTCGTTYHYRAFATNADGTSYGSDATFTTSACDTPTVSTDLYSNATRTTVTLNGTHLTEGVDASTLRGFEYGETTSYGTTVTSPGSLSLMQFGYEDTVEGAFESPYGIALDATGNIYVSDTGNNRIQEFDPDGVFMNMIGWGVAGGVGLETCTTGCTLGTSGSGDGELNAPRGIMIDAAGNINIADYGNNRVQKITPAGSFVSKFGTLGSGVTNLSGPSDIGLVFGTTNPAFLDTGNNRIRPCATYTGCPAADIGTTVLNAPEAMDRSGMFVADTGDSQIHKFVNLGQAVQVTTSYATDIGGLSGPKGIASEDDGALVYVSDTGHDRLLKFSAAGSTGASVIPVTLKFISQFGSSGSASGQFSGPSHIAVNSNNEIFVADTGNHRIQKLSPFFSEDITGLNCGTTYHYRALATNTDGTGYGSDQTFKTVNCSTTTSSGGGPTPRYGCTNTTASNYDFIANTDDGSCEYLGCTDNFANNYNEYALTDDGSCDYTVYVPGCIDTLANNYNPSAEIDDGSCTYGTGTPGCMDPLATNYNASATSDDGSCIVPGGGGPDDILGCTDTFAENFDASATQDNGTCHYVISSVAGCMDEDALNYNPSAMTNDGSCTYEPPPWLPPPVVEIIDTINGAIREVTGWTPQEQANTYKDIALAGIVVPSVFFLIAERSAILSAIIRLWNIIPTLLGFRRKRRPWGTVYDSVTKQPLDPVYVTLRDTAGAEVSTSITDLDGRYGFVTDIGEYKLDAKKTDYVFPSVKMNGQTRDELYENLYFGENIKVDVEDMIINKNIPMDALNFNWNEFEKTKNKKLMKFFSRTELFLARIAKIIFIAGFIASFLLIFLEPKMWNYIILAVYVTIFVLSLLGVRPRKPGFILERETGYPLSFAIITVFSALLNREIAHTVVGKTGKYHILVPKGKYYLKLQKKTGENSYEEIYTSDVFKARKGYIDKTIKV